MLVVDTIIYISCGQRTATYWELGYTHDWVGKSPRPCSWSWLYVYTNRFLEAAGPLVTSCTRAVDHKFNWMDGFSNHASELSTQCRMYEALFVSFCVRTYVLVIKCGRDVSTDIRISTWIFIQCHFTPWISKLPLLNAKYRMRLCKDLVSTCRKMALW